MTKVIFGSVPEWAALHRSFGILYGWYPGFSTGDWISTEFELGDPWGGGPGDNVDGYGNGISDGSGYGRPQR